MVAYGKIKKGYEYPDLQCVVISESDIFGREKKKKKKYETVFGTFTYRNVPSEAFPLGIRLIQEGSRICGYNGA